MQPSYPETEFPMKLDFISMVKNRISMTVEDLKSNIDEFTQLNNEKKREILGELVYPLVFNNCQNRREDAAPKITGMLIDFDVFNEVEIIEMIENREILLERLAEAIEMIAQEEQEEQ